MEVLQPAAPVSRNIVDVYPLSPMQTGLLFHSLLDEQSGAYFVQIRMRLRGELDLALMEQAFRQLVASHGVLRTAIVHEGLRQPQQLVLRSRAAPFACHDLSTLEPALREPALQALLAEDRSRRFVLDKDPLFRMMLVRRAADCFEGVFSFHHIILDGWCVNLLIDGLLGLYERLVQGEREPLLPSVPYKHYIRWVRAQDEGQARDYWRDYLADAPPLAMVPKKAWRSEDAAQALQAQESSRYVNRSFEHGFSEARTRALQALCRNQGLTLNSALQTLWGLALQRYNRSQDVVFGCVVSGRSDELPQVESMVGMMINTLPLRLRCEGSEPFTQVARRLQDEFRQCERQGHLALAEMQRCAGGQGELFDTLFVFQNLPERSAPVSGLHIDQVREVEQTHYDFSLVFKVGEEIRVTCVYNGARIEEAQARAVMEHLQALMDGVLAAPEGRVDALDIVGVEEQGRLLQALSGRSVRLPAQDDLCTRLRQVARERAGHPAVVDGERRLSYEALDRESDALARRLLGLGVREGDLVGLMPGRHARMLLGLLAILKCGAAYVPLDAAMPAPRLAHIVQDTGMRHLLWGGRRAEWTPEGLQVLDLDALLHDGTPEPSLSLPDCHGGMRAYVIYTSGSTGQPKGVQISHRNVLNLHMAFENDLNFRDERMTQFAPLTFDAAAGEIFVTLLDGSTLYLIPESIQQEVDRIQSFLAENAISFASFPPDFFAHFDPALLPQLRSILTAGSRPNVGTIERWRQQARYINAYGPTETTVLSTAWCSDQAPAEQSHLSIGQPLCNTRCCVMDAALRLVPQGVAGELCIAGEGVALGYLNEPALNEQKFVTNPYVAGERMYRSGDLVRQHADGSLEFLGRIDFQTKIRGHRVEPEEVERALLTVPGVAEAVVEPRLVKGVNCLCAYYTRQPGQGDALDALALREALAAVLPSYMLPSYFIALPALPQTRHFKVDRKALPDPVQASQAQAASADSADPWVALVCELWSEVLAVPVSGPQDNFFALGGDSIKAIQVVGQLRKKGQSLRVAQLMQTPTVGEIASLLRREAGPERMPQEAAAESDPTPAPYEPMSLVSELLSEAQIEGLMARLCPPESEALVEDLLPLSPTQQGMLFHGMADAASSAYVGQVLLALQGRIELRRLQRTCEALTARHAALRTAVLSEGLPTAIQVVYDHREADCQALQRPPELAEADWIQQVLHEERARGFDLQQDSLLRMRLLELGGGRQQLLICAHHIVLDGWSMGRLVQDFVSIYAALGRARKPSLPQAQGQAGYLAWLQGRSEAQRAQSRGHWERHLAGAPAGSALELPPVERPDAGQRVLRVQWDAQLSAALAQCARELGVTLSSLFQAMWATLLMRRSGQEDLCFGCVSSGRSIDLPQAQEIVGLMISSVPLRVRAGAARPFAELLREVHRDFIGNEQHGHLGLPAIQAAADRREPLFDHLLVFENFPMGTLAGDGFEVVGSTVIDETHYGFNLVVNPGEQIGLIAAFDAGRHEPAGVQRLLEQLRTLAGSVLQDANQRLDQLVWLPDAERQALLQVLAHSGDESPSGPSLKQRFEQQAATQPDAVAAVDGERRITFGALDGLANQLAHALERLGLRPGEPVAVLADKSLEVLAGVLALHKLGAIYVPLAPSWPAARLAEVVELAGARVALHGRDAGDEALQGLAGRTALGLAGLLATPARLRLGDGQDLALAGESAEPLPDRVGPQDACYLMFTSGTTGRPKGIVNTQGNFSHLAEAVSRSHYRPGRGVLQVAAWHFDASIMDVWGALANGATVHFCEADTAAILRALRTEVIHELMISPSILREMVDALGAAVQAEAAAPTLEQLSCGGEPLHYGLLRQARQRLGAHVRFLNIYGPTETTVFCSSWPVLELESPRSVVEIGRPLPRTGLYVLDAQGQPRARGLVGEICVSGAGLAAGYHAAPETTAAAFLDAVFEPGLRLYRTGDRGRWNEQGALEIVGRQDGQVKVRGYRVELGEVRSAMLAYPGIAEAQVFIDPLDHPTLLKAVHVGSGEAVDDAALRRFLLQRLPDYMVPAFMLAVDSLPSTANHKVDVQALRERLRGAAETSAQSQPLATENERWLAGLMGALLGCAVDDAHANFFALGGNSIKAIDLIARIKMQRGWPAEMSHLYVYPRLRDLAGYYEALQSSGPATDAGRAAAVAASATDMAGAAQHCLQSLDAALRCRVLSRPREGRPGEWRGLAVLAPKACAEADVVWQRLREQLPAQLLPHHLWVGADARRYETEDYEGLFGCPMPSDLPARMDASVEAFLQQRELRQCVKRYAPSPRQALILQRYGLQHLAQNHTDMRIHHPCDDALLRRILGTLVRRHPMLRTTVGVDASGEPCLLEFEDDEVFTLLTLDLSDVPEAAQQRFIRDFLRRVSKPFDLSRGPLHRAILIKENRNSHRWIWTFSHFISDGECGKLMASEFYRCFESFAQGSEPVLEPITATHADYVEAVRREEAGAAAMAVRRQRLSQWLAAVRTVKARMKPWHDPESLARFRSYEVALPAQTLAPTDDPMEWAHAAMLQALAHCTQQTLQPVSSLHHGRVQGGRSFFNLVGDLHDRLPLLVEVDPADVRVTLARFLEQRRAAEADPHHRFHIAEQLVREVPECLEDLCDTPLFFNFTELISYLQWREGQRFEQMEKEHSLRPEGIYDGQCGLLMHRVAPDRLLFSVMGHLLDEAATERLFEAFEHAWLQLDGRAPRRLQTHGLVM